MTIYNPGVKRPFSGETWYSLTWDSIGLKTGLLKPKGQVFRNQTL